MRTAGKLVAGWLRALDRAGALDAWMEKRVWGDTRGYIKLAKEWTRVAVLPASCSFWNAFEGIIEQSHGTSFLGFHCSFFEIFNSFLLLLPNSSHEEINGEKDADE
jgi:hypothetical protein